jgi:hypothetical protein
MAVPEIQPFKFQKLGAIHYEPTGEELKAPSLGAAAAPLTTPFEDPTFFTQPILMQGFSPECGGYSLAFALAYLLNQTNPLSGSFAYAYEKTVDGVPNAEGTTIKAISLAAQNEGTCLDSEFHNDGNTAQNPNGNATPFSQATMQAIQDAATRAGFIPLFLTDLSWTGLQAAVAKYKCVIVEAQVGEEWYTDHNGDTTWDANKILPIEPPAKVIDDHFFVLGGKCNATDIWFANSWSPAWGQNGFGYFAENYVPFVRNAIVFYKAPPSVTVVVNHPTLTEPEKNSIIQQILNDIETAVGLIKNEMAQALPKVENS